MITASSSRLMTVAELRARLPLADAGQVRLHRKNVAAVLSGDDPRLLTLVGPCSVHDPVAGLDYARRLAGVATELGEDLVVVMRAYMEKPRTVLGWTGMVNDPWLDGSADLYAGLFQARRFLLEVTRTGLPVACEFVAPLLAAYLSDIPSWGAIGARTVESQPHRQLASWLDMPVGFKNSTSGNVMSAVSAVLSAANPHVFAGIGADGEPTVLRSSGNPDCHIILRGGEVGGPNYRAPAVAGALELLRSAELPPRLVVDASHGNSGKDHLRQPAVIADLAGQVAGGQWGIVGVMAESFLAEGAQPAGPGPLEYGKSVTDSCMGWERTEESLRVLAAAARKRRRGRRRG